MTRLDHDRQGPVQSGLPLTNLILTTPLLPYSALAPLEYKVLYPFRSFALSSSDEMGLSCKFDLCMCYVKYTTDFENLVCIKIDLLNNIFIMATY